MPRVVLIHWHSAGADERAERLRREGHDVETLSPAGTPGLKRVRDDPPDAFVIDLDRRPSDGRETGGALRRFKATRQVPIVFAGGDAEKVERARRLMPDAVFTAWEGVGQAVHAALGNPPSDPVVPGTFEAYAGQELAPKLGLRSGTTVKLIDAPDGFERRLGEIRKVELAAVVLLFVRSRDELERRLSQAIPAIADGGSLWIAWPKRSSGLRSDLTQVVVRRIGMAAGLVDYKIAALDETWSGLRFARRR